MRVWMIPKTDGISSRKLRIMIGIRSLTMALPNCFIGHSSQSVNSSGAQTASKVKKRI